MKTEVICTLIAHKKITLLPPYCSAALLPQVHVCVVSYDMVQKLPDAFLSSYHVVVVDESHMLKNKDAKRTQVKRGGGDTGEGEGGAHAGEGEGVRTQVRGGGCVHTGEGGGQSATSNRCDAHPSCCPD